MLPDISFILTMITGYLLLPSSIKALSQVDISGLVGSTVKLPCHVDTKTCGNLHSIKWYRGSSRIFVFSDLAKFSKSEGDYESRANLVYQEKDTTSYLQVNNIKISDEALYKCEITYLEVVESCSVVQFINLRTLIAPSFIKVTDENSQEIKKGNFIGPFNEDVSLTLTCEVDEGKPIPTLRWYKNNEETPGVYTINSEASVIGSAKNVKRMKLSRDDLNATYECRASSQALNHTLSVDVHISVNVKPSKMELTSSDQIVKQNSTVILQCAVYEARPEAIITWYNGSKKLEDAEYRISKNVTRLTMRTKVSKNQSGTINTFSRLTFVATRFENMKTFKCVAYNKVMTDKDSSLFEKKITLEVHYAPIITIAPQKITVNETENVYLNCIYEANPSNIINKSWYFNGNLLTKNDTLYDIQDNTLILKKVNRHFLGKYFCSLQNVVATTNSTEVEVNVLYPPSVYVEADTATIIKESAETNVSLFCRVQRGNPRNLSTVQWYFNNIPMYKYPNVSNLFLEKVKKEHHGNYSCSGKTEAGWGFVSPPKEVIVQYQPGAANITYYVEHPNRSKYENNNVIIKGSVIYLECYVENLGRPKATTYHWYEGFNEVFKDINDNILKLSNVGVKEKLSNYSCNAQNAAGYGKNATISINISAPPSFINTKNYVYVAKTSKVATMRCDIECDPPCKVSWMRNKLPLENDDIYQIENTIIPANLDKNDFESVASVLRLNLTNLPNGHAEPYRDDATYTCLSSPNAVGDGVKTDIDFKVHFAPINVTVRHQIVNVTDGRIPPKVTCTATARPEPNFRWYNGTSNVTFSSEATLSFNSALSKDFSTNFTCEASNDYGTDTAVVYFNILFKPICNVKLYKNEGKKLLLCEAIGNPQPLYYNWTTEGKSILNERDNFLEIEAVAESKVYNCTATNEIQSSDPCSIEIPASDDWWLFRIIRSYDLPVAYVIIAAVIIFAVLIICIFIILICRKRRAKEKYSNQVDLPNRQNFDENNIDGPPAAPVIPKWPLKPGVLVHVNNNHSLSARRLQNSSNVNSNSSNMQSQSQFYSATEKRPKREQHRFKTDTLPGVFHGKSGVVSFKKFDNTVVPTNPRKRKKPGSGPTDLSGKNKNNYHSSNDGVLQTDNDKAFYENLPFHGMQNPPNKVDCENVNNTRPPSVQSLYDGSSGYGSTRSHIVNGTERAEISQNSTDNKFNSYRPKRLKRNWPQFRSLRASKKNKIPMIPIKENSPESKLNNLIEESPKILPKPVPAPRKVIGFSFNKPSTKHTYQNIPIPITPNKISIPQMTTVEHSVLKQASSHLTNSSPMEYFRLTPSINTRPYNGNIPSNISLKKYKYSSNNTFSSSLSRDDPPTIPKHQNSSYPSTHQLNNGLVYADLTVSRHKKKHHRQPPISSTKTYPYHTEYAVIKFHDVGREIDV